MRSIIMYYSYTGNCKKLAMKLKKDDQAADLCEVRDKKRAGMFKTFMVNCPKAAMRKKVAIEEITVNLNQYDKFILIAPIWNQYPAPEFNSIVKKLPSGKEVELYFCSGSGDSSKSKEGTCEMIKKAGCRVAGYHDIQTAVKKEK